MVAAGEDFRYTGIEGKRVPGTSIVNWYVGHVHKATRSDAVIGCTSAPPQDDGLPENGCLAYLADFKNVFDNLSVWIQKLQHRWETIRRWPSADPAHTAVPGAAHDFTAAAR